MSTPIVLFVDDEVNILKTLRRLFLDEDYDLHVACGGQEALDLIESGVSPTVIVSDQRMPGMGGAEFLEKAKVLVPDSIRMVLTGYADINAAVAAINLGGIYRYIMKPWNDDDLKLTVHDAIEHYNLIQLTRSLTLELKEKNEALAELNRDLEKKVELRTKEIQLKVKELEGRDKIQQYLLNVHPLDETLQLVVDVAAEVVNTKWAALYLVADDSTVPLQKAAAPNDLLLSTEALKCLFSFVIEHLKPTAADVAGVLSGGDSMEDCHVTAIPIKTKDTLYGVLFVSLQEGDKMTAASGRSLMSYCEQAAIAIKDSKLAEQIPDLGSDLDDILKNIQNS